MFEDLLDIVILKVGDLEYFDEDMNDHEWGTSTSAACCLKILASLMKDEIVDPIINKAGGYTTDSDPKIRYIGLMILGAIVEGPSSRCIATKFEPALEVLFDLLDDPHQKVRETSAWMFILLVCSAP